MNELRKKRIEAKYSGMKAGTDAKQMEIGPRGGRDRALGASGKPKNMKASILRLMKYIAHEKGLILAAICCAVLYTVSSLAASYLLRPIINKFIYFDPADGNFAARLEGLALWLTFLAAVYAVSVLCHWLQQWLMLRASQKTLVVCGRSCLPSCRACRSVILTPIPPVILCPASPTMSTPWVKC